MLFSERSVGKARFAERKPRVFDQFVTVIKKADRKPYTSEYVEYITVDVAPEQLKVVEKEIEADGAGKRLFDLPLVNSVYNSWAG